MTFYEQPKNTMPRIDRVWAFLSVDPKDGNEGVCAALIEGAWVPFVAADPRRLAALEKLAREIAKKSGIKIKLVEFATRTEVREITP